MTDIELLREAARLMRERAQAATPSPWGVGNGTNIVRGLEVTGRGSYTCIQSVAEVDDDRCDWDRDEAVEISPEYDAGHIASWHPAVALAVADWLDESAGHLELHIPAWTAPSRGVDDPPAVAWNNPEALAAVIEHHYGRALAVARAYLGSAS